MKYMMFLIVISNVHLASQGKGSGICLNDGIDNLQDRSFSGSVIPDNRNFFATFHRKIQVREQLLAVKGFGKMFYF